MDVDKCINEEYLNEENSGMDIGEMKYHKVISLEEICSMVDRGETVVGKYGGKYLDITEASGEFRVPNKHEIRFKKENIDVVVDKLYTSRSLKNGEGTVNVKVGESKNYIKKLDNESVEIESGVTSIEPDNQETNISVRGCSHVDGEKVIPKEGEQGVLNNEVDKVVLGDTIYWGGLDLMMSRPRGAFKASYLSELAAKKERMMEGVGIGDGPIDVLDDLSREEHEKLLIFV